jgi:hypothetical protein
VGETAPEAGSGTATARPRHAEAIVLLPLLGIAQDLVRLDDFFELGLGRRIAVVAIGMVLHRQATVRLLDLGFRRVPLEAKYVVKVLCHSSYFTRSPRRRLVCSTMVTTFS